MAAVAHQNGLMSPPPTDTGSVAASPPRVVLAGKTGRILCVADIRGDYHELNRLIREHEATAVIHTGDFGFMNADSLDRMGDKILRHLLQYSPLIANGTRQSLLNIPPTAGRQALIEALNNSSIHFPLSQFPHLISGAITFPVPVFTVWGLIEDVRVLEKFRSGEYEVHNLSIIDEATSRVLDVGGLRLRLFGLGGAVAPHKMFDNGEGQGTIAGGQGTMWTTTLQMGELVDTAIRHFDPSETRLFISSACVSRLGILSQLSAAIKADLTISGGLHFRYPASFNDFSVHADFEAYRQKLAASRDVYMGIYASVKERVEPSLSENQLAQLKKALGVMQRVPEADDGSWTNTWHWVLSDASCGHLLFSINEGRVSAETHSQGLNFSHRAAKAAPPPSAPKQLLSNPLATPTARTAATPAQLTQRQAPTAAARPDTNAQPALPPPMSSANGSSAAGTASNPVVRPPGVSATPSARPSMGHQAVRPSFNGPNGSAMQNAQNQNQNQNAMGMQMRPGMMARPPLGGAKSGNAFGTPPAGLARPPQAPRAPRAVSGGQAQSQQGQAQGQVAKADDAKSTRPGPAAAAAASTNVKPASNAAAAAASTATPTVNGQEKRENRFAPLANVREPREPREPREAREPREPREVRERDVKGKDKKEGVNGTVEKGKKADKGEKKEEDKTKDAKDTAPSSAAGVKGKADKTERADKADKGERKDAKATATATTTAPAPAQAAKDTKPASAEKKDQEKEAAKKEEGPAAAGTTASAPASGAATPAGSDDKAQPQAKVQVHKPALFLKSVPAGTEEGDLRAMFGESKDKIQSARIVKGKFSKPDFAYIDFATDEDVTKALSECTKKIKDTEVSVVISNPPQKFHTGGRGGRGGMSRGGGGGRGGMRPPRTGSGAGRDGPSPAPPAAAAAAK